MSTNMLDKCKRGQESLLCSGATTEPKKRSELRKVSSVTLSEEPVFILVNSEMLAKSSAETSSPAKPKIPTSRQSKKSKKASKTCVKSNTEQKFQDESAPPAAPARKAKRKRNDRKKATVLTFCTKTLSDQTSAPLASKKKSTKRKKEEIELLDEAEAEISANMFDKFDTGQESQLCSGPTAEPKNWRQLRKISLATLEDMSVFVRHDVEKTESSVVQIFSVDSPYKQRKKSNKGSNTGVKKRSKQRSSPQTLTEDSDVIKQAVREDSLASRNDADKSSGLHRSTLDSVTSPVPAEKLGKKRKERKKETLLCSSPTTEPKKMKQPRKVSSATLKIEPTVARGTSGESPAETSRDDVLKIQESGQRQETGRSKNLSVKHGKKQELGARENVTTDSTAQFAFNRKKTSTSKKKAKAKSEVLVAAETDCNTSLLNKSNTTRSKNKEQPRKVSSATLKIEPRIAGETSGEGAGETPSDDVSGRRQETARSAKVSVKGGNRQNPLTHTLRNEQVKSGKARKRNNDSDKEPVPTVSTDVLSDKMTATEYKRRKTSSVDRPKTRAFTQRRKTQRGMKVGVTKGAEQKPSARLVKPFRCSVCAVSGKQFRKSSQVNSHGKTHWPAKPYSCSVCWKGFTKLQELKKHSEMHLRPRTFSCTGCKKVFSSFQLLRSHRRLALCPERQETAPTNQSNPDGVLVSRNVEGHVLTPTYFRCHVCKQLHRHWCQHTRLVKSFTCEACRCEQTGGVRSHCGDHGEEKVCRSSLTDAGKELANRVLEPHPDDARVPLDEDQTGLTSVETAEEAPSISSLSAKDVESQPLGISTRSTVNPKSCPRHSGSRLRSLIRPLCGKLSHGHCGKSFSQWNRPWLRQRFHRKTTRPTFSCSQCSLEFRFLGSYMDHLREHIAQRPHAWLLCSQAFVDPQVLRTHISESHSPQYCFKCGKCGKNFSHLANLMRHKPLHKGAGAHFCLPCNASFSSHSALKTHLKTHGTRVKVPQPAGPVEPLSFPYPCRKCPARFSSADLLQAHQVCHFTAGRTLPQTLGSRIPSRAAEDPPRVNSESSQPKRRLPVSNKKHLFRYPHPDRLYVVPVISSEPPVVVSDAEGEQLEDQSLSITTSDSNTMPGHHSAASLDSSDRDILNIPQFSAVSMHMQEQETDVTTNQVLLESHRDSCKNANDFSSFESDLDNMCFTKKSGLAVDIHSCRICMEPFTEISRLHEHYVHHARGM